MLGGRSFYSHTHTRDNIKIDLKGLRCKGVDWVYLA
jgi:hypothetical protein